MRACQLIGVIGVVSWVMVSAGTARAQHVIDSAQPPAAQSATAQSGTVQPATVHTVAESSAPSEARTVAAAGAVDAGLAAALEGTWTYRSFVSDPDVDKPFNDIRFGAGILRIESAGGGQFRGRLDFGEEFQLALRGWTSYGNPVTVVFQGRGDRSGSSDWVYDYRGFYAPEWPQGVNQRPAIVGSIVRSQPHSGGSAPAGVVACWIAVKQDAAPPTPAAAGARRSGFAPAQPANAPSEADAASLKGPRSAALAQASTTEFSNPPEIVSQGGILSTTLDVRYADNTIGGEPVRLRNYNGQLIGPTLRAKPGDVLRIRIDNHLPQPATPTANRGHGHGRAAASLRPAHTADHAGDVNRPHGFNVTNLHTHGLHVSPAGNSDNVLVEIGPGESFDYTIAIPPAHPPGTFWYHAHKHGSVAIQLASGMQGALIVAGDLDDVPAIAAAQEQILVFQQIPYDESAVGVVEDFSASFGPGKWQTLGRYTTINGLVTPVIRMAPGEVQRWRMVHGGVRESLRVKLDGHVFKQIALDGITTGKMTDEPVVQLEPGYRSEVLVQASNTPGRYLLRDEALAARAALLAEDEPEKFLAVVEVVGTPNAMALPDPAALAPLLRYRSIDPGELTGFQTAVLNIDLRPAQIGLPNEFQVNYRDFDPSAPPRMLRLGKVEEWLLRSDFVNHPFHVHVNPFQVISIKNSQGQELLAEPMWKDTILVHEGERITVRTRYEQFLGKFPLHCHILDHEDQGMMEMLEIVP
ncbi:MAG: multicopper oxidase domain-containing protein [Pirellulales bacterium]|nr:multicopper oxidase domain-containing protein [Pirellulales bacterium]